MQMLRLFLKNILWSLLFFSSFFLLFTHAIPVVWDPVRIDWILTHDSSSFLDTEPIEDDAVRKGMHTAITNPRGEKDNERIENLLSSWSEIDSHETATQKTLRIIHNILNYVLGFATAVALIMIIIGGIKVLTAAGNDKQFAEGKKSISKVAIALIWIGFSWLIVSLIFWFLRLITAT